jgi:hypothetical protein
MWNCLPGKEMRWDRTPAFNLEISRRLDGSHKPEPFAAARSRPRAREERGGAWIHAPGRPFRPLAWGVKSTLITEESLVFPPLMLF